jgi:hypothetical protein
LVSRVFLTVIFVEKMMKQGGRGFLCALFVLLALASPALSQTDDPTTGLPRSTRPSQSDLPINPL